MMQKAFGIVLKIWQALKIGSYFININCTMTFNIFIIITFGIKMIAHTYGPTPKDFFA